MVRLRAHKVYRVCRLAHWEGGGASSFWAWGLGLKVRGWLGELFGFSLVGGQGSVFVGGCHLGKKQP